MINKVYHKNLERIKTTFETEGSITLLSFFDEEYFNGLQKKIGKLNFKKENDPVTHSYSKASYHLNDPDLVQFIKLLTGKTIKTSTAYSFQWKDYTILNDKFKPKPGLDIVLDLTNNWQTDWGGTTFYSDGKEDYIQVASSRNSLTIVKWIGRKFVKYVNHQSQGKRILLKFNL